jgi:hypothetical protein
MKNLHFLISFLLISITAQAKFLPVILTFENGTKKTGFAKLVEDTDKSISFKSTNDGVVEKVLSTELKNLKYTESEGQEIIFERLHSYSYKKDIGIKKSKNKFWLKIIYSNGLKLAFNATASTYGYNAITNQSTGMIGGQNLYLGREDGDGVFFITFLSSGFGTTIGLDKMVRNRCNVLFTDCPQFVEAVNKEDFKDKTVINQLVDLYIISCGKTAKKTKKKK